jgi:uncharacterized membrane protein YidH (DUF202 family)
MGRKAVHLLTTLATASAIALPAAAYVGPGAGLTAIGSILALIGAVALMIVGFIWYPVKRILRRRKSKKTVAAPPAQDVGKDGEGQ